MDREAIHQVINDLPCVLVGPGCEVGISGRGQDRAMAEDLLDFKQVDACFDQMGCIAMAQTVGCDLFLIPQS
jgi:hypothetical protein